MFVHVSARENLFSLKCSKVPTEIVRSPKTLKIWVFFEKEIKFSKKLDFLKNAKYGKFAVKCVSNGNISLKKSFPPYL